MAIALAVLFALMPAVTYAADVFSRPPWQKTADPQNTSTTDVDMYSPYIPLPLYLSEAEAGGHVRQVSGAKSIRLVSGSRAEAETTFPVGKRGAKRWWVWAKLPDETGTWVFEKDVTRYSVKVTADRKNPTLQRITVSRSGHGEAPGGVVTRMIRQRFVNVPIDGGIRQVSGPSVKLERRAGATLATIPDQVCTLIFEDKAGEKRFVVRVWEDKGSRFFVSTKGDDANPGTERKPFKTIHFARKHVIKNDPKRQADIYVAGGDYDLGSEALVMSGRISLYGGFDENGWRRDPIITESVLLPHGFRENWINDITDRYKDLRRPDHRYYETRLSRDDKAVLVVVGPNWRAREAATGTPDTFLDGVTCYGPDRLRGETSLGGSVRHQRRTVRNCIMISGYCMGHAFSMFTGGRGLVENNLVVMPITSRVRNCRPQITGGFGHWRRNLILGATGGNYSRVINMWGNGGFFTENQIHGGNVNGWSGFQAAHKSTRATRSHVFRNNLIRMDYLFKYFHATGLIMENNDITLLKGGISTLYVARDLTIRNNTFRLPKGFGKAQLFPANRVTQRLGGTFVREKLIPPEPGKGRPVTIQGNKYLESESNDRRHWNLIDLKTFNEAIREKGVRACLRPEDPARNLRAEVTGRTVQLNWDGSKGPDVVGYIVRHGPKPNSLMNPLFAGKATQAEIRNLKPGTYYFTVVPYKKGLVECWTMSNEVVVTVKDAKKPG